MMGVGLYLNYTSNTQHMQTVRTGAGSLPTVVGPQPVCTGIIASPGDQLCYVAVEMMTGLVISVLQGTSSKCSGCIKIPPLHHLHACGCGGLSPMTGKTNVAFWGFNSTCQTDIHAGPHWHLTAVHLLTRPGVNSTCVDTVYLS